MAATNAPIVIETAILKNDGNGYAIRMKASGVVLIVNFDEIAQNISSAQMFLKFVINTILNQIPEGSNGLLNDYMSKLSAIVDDIDKFRDIIEPLANIFYVEEDCYNTITIHGDGRIGMKFSGSVDLNVLSYITSIINVAKQSLGI